MTRPQAGRPAGDELELTVLLPCLNEAETLAACIGKALGELARLGVRGEVLVADNGSTDGSDRIAVESGARLVRVGAKGYGAALRGGIEAARGRYVIMGDADDSYDFGALGPFVEKLREGNDLVMGNRFRGGIAPGAMPFLHRYLGNPVLSALGRLFFGCESRDFHCGLRGFSRDRIRQLDLQTTGMEFASEMVIKAALAGLRVVEVPTTLAPDGRTRRPHLRTWRDGWRHLRFMLLYSPTWLFVYPGLLLAAAGLAVGARLFFGPVRIGDVNFDVQTMLFAATGTIVGFQAFLFGVFAKVFAATAGLLPPGSRLAALARGWKLEWGVAAGLLTTVAGLAGAVRSVVFWAQSSFGPLDVAVTLRMIIPSATAMVLGGQMVLGSFFLSVLALQRGPPSADDAA